MKKQLLSLIFAAAGLSMAAQTQRVSLFEEFTGENCPPCASTNPGLDADLKLSPSLIIPIKWQVPIPSAPSATWSLYQTNKAEINWRTGTYGYGINSAPSCRIDGKNATAFGMQSDHPGYYSPSIATTAASYTSPFSISMNRAWNANLTAVTLTINIQASANYTSTGALYYRLVLIEKEIVFATAPGTNGEKEFNWVVRRSYPTTMSGNNVTQMGTAMTQSWTTGQTSTFTINCVLPPYIVDKSEVAFVGFIQDDGNREVQQTAMADIDPMPNDVKAMSANVNNYFDCNAPVIPQIEVKNNGSTAITAMTITPTIDNVVANASTWTGNLAVGATTLITLDALTTSTNGGHNVTLNITSVSGSDLNTSNNIASTSFYRSASYITMDVAEGFVATAFPPALFGVENVNGGASWSRISTAGGFGLSSTSAKYDFFNNNVLGDADDLYLPPLNLTGGATPLLTFDVAYAQYTSANTDQLDVLVSDDCGANWTGIYSAAGAALSTRGPLNPNPFTPTPSQWRTENAYLPGFNLGTLLVKFRATSNFGNNLYLDNINLRQEDPVGIKAVNSSVLGISLYPNPSNGITTLHVNALVSSTSKVIVANALGQVVYTTDIALSAGSNNFTIDASNFASGIYSVIVDSNNTKTVKKLTVN